MGSNLLAGNTWPSSRGITSSGAPSNNYAGANTSRPTMAQARAARRQGGWGNWGGYLAIPTAALWFDELALASMAEDDEMDALAPAIIDIWG